MRSCSTAGGGGPVPGQAGCCRGGRDGGGAGAEEVRAAFRRAVARRLRAAGTTPPCASRGGGFRWHHGRDVRVRRRGRAGGEGQKSRYIVDADFRAGLEVARATAEYAVVGAVPASVVVAREEAVGRAVRVAADAARRSLRSHGLHVRRGARPGTCSPSGSAPTRGRRPPRRRPPEQCRCPPPPPGWTSSAAPSGSSRRRRRSGGEDQVDSAMKHHNQGIN